MPTTNAASDNIVEKFRSVLGRKYVLTGHHKTKTYRTGYRGQSGECLAVLLPGSLLELWRTLQIAVENDLNIIMQAANTGLTGGSTPHAGYDHDVVIISTNRLEKIYPIDNGNQVICFPGSTLHKLEQTLAPLNRDPHSVIGSSCLGASVIGGVCNNSGGALVERGPAYTEHSLFAKLTEDGELALENGLGVDLGSTPEDILTRLDNKTFSDTDIAPSNGMASDHEYKDWVRDIHAPTPARYNADPRRLKQASGCGGKLAVFAVRLDTFPKNTAEKTFFIGTNKTAVLTTLRRKILADFAELPVLAEYMEQNCFKFTERYGRDTVYLIKTLGTQRLPTFFKLKETLASHLDDIPFLSSSLIDQCLQVFSRFAPNPLPKTIKEIADKRAHLLILKVKDRSVDETRKLLSELSEDYDVLFHACTDKEASTVGLHRFAAAGAAVRYQTIKSKDVGEVLALDIALPRNTTDWQEKLPQSLDQKIENKLYYGHFMCQVFHQDYILKAGTDTGAIKSEMLDLLKQRGAKYPAEHNVGHAYQAEPQLAEHYRALDPRNQLNPGIGKDSKRRFYAE
ncbi:D-lactate dehydrogenase [Hyphococcus sp. DH-69]|uniref:D-lactate dehydrogenase n=1 Tax=Hyphococcus formosus TaxID=3143534 RepID=UPI00398A5451